MLSSVPLVCRHGNPLPSEVFRHDEGAREEQVGNLEEGEDLYPVSSQWEAKHEEKVNKAPPVAAITEKVILTLYSPLRIVLIPHKGLIPHLILQPSLSSGQQGDQHGQLVAVAALLGRSTQRAPSRCPPAEPVHEGEHHHPLQDILPWPSEPVHLQGNRSSPALTSALQNQQFGLKHDLCR